MIRVTWVLGCTALQPQLGPAPNEQLEGMRRTRTHRTRQNIATGKWSGNLEERFEYLSKLAVMGLLLLAVQELLVRPPLASGASCPRALERGSWAKM